MNHKRAAGILQVKSVNRETYTIRFVFSTAIVDRHGEVIDQKGWKLENYIKNPTVLWGHDQDKFPIGRTENMSNDGQLEGDVVFAYKENPDAAMAFELCAGGFLNAGSVGFANLKWMYDEPNDLLTLLENELYEFSIVNVPANPEALAKAMTDMEEKGVDKRVIAHVKTFQENAIAKAKDRFVGLGEEVKTEKTETKAPEVPADPVPPVETPKPEPEAPATEDAAKAVTLDEAISALDVLLRSDNGIIHASVRELTERLGDAESTQRRSTVGAPQKHPVKQFNRLINRLAKSKAKNNTHA